MALQTATTKDPVQAWEAGLTWVLVQSFVLTVGGFIAPVIRKITPRAALLGSLAGISITFISMRPGAQAAMTPIYIGHPGWKAMGGRIGYSVATGVLVIVLAWFGILALMMALIPVVATLPILLYIGMLIGSQAFQEPRAGHRAGAGAADRGLGQDPDRRCT